MSAFAMVCLFAWCGAGCSARRRAEPLPPGKFGEAIAVRRSPAPVSPAELRTVALEHWAAQPMPTQGPDMKTRGTRTLLARLATGRDIGEVNEFLQGAVPWSVSGSEWDVRELFGFKKRYTDRLRLGHRGDYDFTAAGLVSILMLFGDQPEVLHPDTVDRLVEVLLIDTGGRPQPRVPRSLGLVAETENHVLMTESSRYLANQWRRSRGCPSPRHDNRANGLEMWLLRYLRRIQERGFDEYDSIPYQGYSLHALLNLEAFADSPELAGLARELLDTVAWEYALGSLDFRRCVPFRRQLAHADTTDPSRDPLSLMMAVWTADAVSGDTPSLRRRAATSAHGMMAAALPYSPPPELLAFLARRPRPEYFVRIGRGRNASPALFSGGPGFLLSAGGVAFGPRMLSETVARPVTLLLADGETDLTRCFRIPGGSPDMLGWNHTGVAHLFACGNAPVEIPPQAESIVQEGAWSVFRPLPEEELLLLVHRSANLGIMALFPEPTLAPEELLRVAAAANGEGDLRRQFVFPATGRVVAYDVDAPTSEWVIAADGGETLERDYASWTRLAVREEDMGRLLPD